VKRAVPNLDSVSLARRRKCCAFAALKEFTEATEQWIARSRKPRNGSPDTDQRSEAEKQAAVKQLQQVQAEHTAKLKQITARLQDQITALQQSKGSDARIRFTNDRPANPRCDLAEN